jgi:hypothetical protein
MQRPITAEQLQRWRAEAKGLDALAEHGSDRRARVAVMDVSVVLALLDEIQRLKTCVHPGAGGVCMPRISDGWCVWCERPLPPGWLDSVVPRGHSTATGQSNG